MSHKTAQILNSISLLSFGLLVLTTDVLAHQDASDPDFCSDNDKIEIGTVSLNGSSLENLLKDKPVDCPIGVKELRDRSSRVNKELHQYVGEVMINRNPTMKRHDWFDSQPAQYAYAYASCVCASLANQDYEPNEIRPMIISPEILLNENHHVDYNLEDGIEFSCHVCK